MPCILIDFVIDLEKRATLFFITAQLKISCTLFREGSPLKRESRSYKRTKIDRRLKIEVVSVKSF